MMPIKKRMKPATSEGARQGHVGKVWERNKSDDQSNYDKIHGLVMIFVLSSFQLLLLL